MEQITHAGVVFDGDCSTDACSHAPKSKAQTSKKKEVKTTGSSNGKAKSKTKRAKKP
jgi:hypothetical protein